MMMKLIQKFTKIFEIEIWDARFKLYCHIFVPIFVTKVIDPNFVNESNGIFVLGVVFFYSSDKFRLFNEPFLTEIF